MSFIYDIARTVLKVVFIRQLVRLQRHANVFRHITAYGGIFKAYFKVYCTKYYKINLFQSDIPKQVFY